METSAQDATYIFVVEPDLEILPAAFAAIDLTSPLDRFNQTGNITFRRQHAALASKPGRLSAPQELCAMHVASSQTLAGSAQILAEAPSHFQEACAMGDQPFRASGELSGCFRSAFITSEGGICDREAATFSRRMAS